MNNLTDKEIAELRKRATVLKRCMDGGDSAGGMEDYALDAASGALRLLDEIERRRGRDARLLGLLKRIEWSADTAGAGYCPSCGGFVPHKRIPPPNVIDGHKPDCALASLIAELLADAPETPEEKAALDKLAKAPEETLAEARARGDIDMNGQARIILEKK